MPESRVVKAFLEGRHHDLPPVEVTVGTSATLLLKRNPNRTQIVIVNHGSAYGSTRGNTPPASTSQGDRIEAGGIHVFRVDKDGSRVQAEWYALLSSGSGTFTVTEYVADR